MVDNNNSMLIFLHILKTGGSTLQSILQKQYSKWILINENEKVLNKQTINELLIENNMEDVNCMFGHYPYGIHKHFFRSYQYITFLREPVERVISLYYYIKNTKGHSMYNSMQKVSLDEFVSREEYKHLVCNHQTGYLSGECSLITGYINNPNLPLAIQNIENDFTVVGIMEMYEESLYLMKQNLKWSEQVFNYSKQNINKNKPLKEQIPLEIIRKIEELIILDRKLYTYSKERLIEAINNLPPIEKDQLANFKNTINIANNKF